MADRGPRAGRRVTVALLLTLALAAAGCGGHPVTRADLIARANAVCATAARTIRAVPEPPAASGAALAHYLATVAPILSRETAALGALPRPAGGDPLARFLSGERALEIDYRTLTAAARSGSEARINRALTLIAAEHIGARAGRDGLSQCAGTTATVR